MIPHVCPHCSFANQENAMWCSQCKKIIPITANNFFITLNLPQQFELDLQRLESNFFAQLRQTHPDKFINQEKSAIEIALQNSFIINQAYKQLKSPYSRLEHLLSIAGFDIDQQVEITDLVFLEETFVWRESLAEAKTPGELFKLIVAIQKVEEEEFNKAARLIAEKLYSEALQVYIKLKFLKRFLAEAQLREDDYEAI
jgi:molecular chaperone HscB